MFFLQSSILQQLIVYGLLLGLSLLVIKRIVRELLLLLVLYWLIEMIRLLLELECPLLGENLLLPIKQLLLLPLQLLLLLLLLLVGHVNEIIRKSVSVLSALWQDELWPVRCGF